MAEIKIEKKSPVWPWILLGIVIIAIIAYMVYNNDTEDNAIYEDDVNSENMDSNSNTYEEDYQTSTPYIDSTSTFQDFENSLIDSTRIGMDSTYTKTAIMNLAKVVSMKADQMNLQSSMALENVKNYSNEMVRMANSEIPERYDIYKNFKMVSKDIVTVLESIQTTRYPALQEDVTALKEASQNIDSNIATKEQQHSIQSFFTQAKKVVNNMNS